MTTTPESTPAARPSTLEGVLTVAAPPLMAAGVLLAGVGQLVGVVVAFVAMLLVPTVQELTTRRQPATVPPAVRARNSAVAIAAGVLGFVAAVAQWREAPVESPLLWVFPLLTAIAVVAALLLIRRR